MKKKGFTLVELLAVIAILSIIVLVAVPTFNKYVFNSKNQYYKTLESSVKTAGMEYMSENPMFLPKKVGYYQTIDKDILLASGIIENVTDSEGIECEKISVVVKKNNNNNYEYETCLKCGDYETDNPVCRGEYDDWSGSEGDKDKTAPDVTDIYVSDKKTNAITVNALCYDGESDIIGYTYHMIDKVTNEEVKVESSKSTNKFDGLIDNREYNFRVVCKNEAGLTRESKDIVALTAKFTNPTFKEIKTSDGYPVAGFNYSPERDVQTTFNSYNIEPEDVKYFVRSTVDIISKAYVYECSGDLNTLNQNNCSTNATKNIQANKWYKTSDLNTVTTFATDTIDSEGKIIEHTLYAQIGDGINLSGYVFHNIINIDVSYPTISVLKNPLTLGKDDYNFINNVNYTFGFSEGNILCKDSISGGQVSRKTGKYDVICTATGNNGLVKTVTFEVKHSYNATKKIQTYNAYEIKERICGKNMSFIGTWNYSGTTWYLYRNNECWNSCHSTADRHSCCNLTGPYPENCCCNKTVGYKCSDGDKLSGSICYKTVYTCPDGGDLKGTICEYN